MQIEVLLFGPEARRLGRDRLAVELPDGQATCTQLRHAIADADLESISDGKTVVQAISTYLLRGGKARKYLRYRLS